MWNVWKIQENTATLALIVLFPLFMFYHLMSAMLGSSGGPVLGGLFGYASAVFAAIFVALLPFVIRRLYASGTRYPISVMIFMAFALMWTLVHVMMLDGDYLNAASQQSIETIVLWASLFFAGLFLPGNSRLIVRVFWWSFILMLGFLVVHFIQTGSLTFVAQNEYGGENVAGYQGFARSALIILLVLMAASKNVAQQLGVLAGGIFVLFLLGARSEFYAFLLAMTALLSMLALRDGRYAFLFAVAILGVVSVVVTSFDVLVQSRQMQVVDLSSSGSWQARQTLEKIALRQINDNVVFGYFGGHVAEAGSTGRYAHNALSAWVNFGLLGFVWYVGLSVIALFYTTKRILVDRVNDSTWRLSFSTNLICVFLIIVAKSVFWPIVALGWGLFGRALLHPLVATESIRETEHEQARFTEKCSPNRPV